MTLHVYYPPSSLDHKGFPTKNVISATIANIASKQVQWYTRVSPKSYTAALHAAGTVCEAVEIVSALKGGTDVKALEDCVKSHLQSLGR